MITRIFAVPKQYKRDISKFLTFYNFDAYLITRVKGERKDWGSCNSNTAVEVARLFSPGFKVAPFENV